MQIRWCPGMRFKMPFETEDSSRISWFMGTVSSVQVADPRWPDSPWRLLQLLFPPFDHTPTTPMRAPNNNNYSALQKPSTSENKVSCFLSMASPTTQPSKKLDSDVKPPQVGAFWPNNSHGATDLSEQLC
ncbi:Auxin response factor [Sesbania bispinosa]|nr:Auxin response factor [Sesbania bispinosa]